MASHGCCLELVEFLDSVRLCRPPTQRGPFCLPSFVTTNPHGDTDSHGAGSLITAALRLPAELYGVRQGSILYPCGRVLILVATGLVCGREAPSTVVQHWTGNITSSSSNIARCDTGSGGVTKATSRRRYWHRATTQLY